MLKQAVERIGPVMLLVSLAMAPVRGQSLADETKSRVPAIADDPKIIDPAAFIPPKLAALATRDFSSSSLREAIAWLRAAHGLVVLVDENALSEVDVSPAEPISDQLGNDPIYLLLNRLRAVDLAWYYEDDILHITSAERAAELATTLPHNVGDLLDAGFELNRLVDVIFGTVAPESWAENGTGEGDLNALGDVLFVRQSAKLHREVAALVAALRSPARQTFVNDPPQHVKLRKQLKEPVVVDFNDAPLEAAVAELARAAQADIRLDRPSLRSQRIREREPVSLKLSNRKLSTVLQALVLNLELTWILRDGVLWITTVDEAVTFHKTAVYDVRDLCRDAGESVALIDAIVAQAEPDSWADNGRGEGAIEYARPGILVISQQERIHMGVLELLESYRTALRLSKLRDRDQADPNEVVTVYYRLNAKVAIDLAKLLPCLVKPESWLGDAHPDASGEIMVAASTPDLAKIAGTSAVTADGGATGNSLVIEQAVMIVRQTRAVQDEVVKIIRRIERGDSRSGAGAGGGVGGRGGGGFGGGFFTVSPNGEPH